jgi:TDG/mug DNA glycosylase family protein
MPAVEPPATAAGAANDGATRRRSAAKGPTREQLAAAAGSLVADVIAPGLGILFCGINPGLYSGVTGQHFARPGNRFWRVLHLSGLTARELAPSESDELLASGIGITNLVGRATARADELSREELVAGAAALEEKVARLAPAALAVLGMQAYRTGFGARAALGRQPHDIGTAAVFVLPNPSGLQAHYQLPDLVRIFGELAPYLRRAGRGH